MIELKKVRKTFTQGREKIYALKDTDFVANRGEFVAIIGPSGSGKSTFLTIVGGLQTPTSGEVTLDGIRIDRANAKELSRIRFEKLGFILQASALVPFLTVEEQLAFHFKVARTTVDRERHRALLDELGLLDLAKKYPADLSGGERQRVAIATSLVHEPDVILADEPTASLDTDRAFEIVAILRDLTHEKNKTTIMVTHDQRLLDYCDRVYEIRDGVLSEQTDW
ncbi:MAG: ABC transporter ATP-binding protein [Actinomycetaceae bacterium]|nr:ABC transporter ATP-binding protein [Actinomycetaceae bacterium]